MAYELIETIELTASASSIEFTSIPDTGVDLLLMFSTRGDQALSNDKVSMTLNNDTTNGNYQVVELDGTGTAAQSPAYSAIPRVGFQPEASATSNTFSSGEVTIANYTSSAAKSISVNSVSEDNATAAWQVIAAISWAGTSAVTSLKIYPDNNFVQYSTASLYIIS